MSDFVKNAVIASLSKDISWQGQVQGSIEALRSDIKRIDKSVDLSARIFLHWVEYYFTYTKSLGDMPTAQKIILAEDGKARAKSMLEAFKKNMKGKPGLLEIILAEYLTQEVKTE